MKFFSFDEDVKKAMPPKGVEIFSREKDGSLQKVDQKPLTPEELEDRKINEMVEEWNDEKLRRDFPPEDTFKLNQVINEDSCERDRIKHALATDELIGEFSKMGLTFFKDQSSLDWNDYTLKEKAWLRINNPAFYREIIKSSNPKEELKIDPNETEW
jgi:hypothetical protein